MSALPTCSFPGAIVILLAVGGREGEHVPVPHGRAPVRLLGGLLGHGRLGCAARIQVAEGIPCEFCSDDPRRL